VHFVRFAHCAGRVYDAPLAKALGLQEPQAMTNQTMSRYVLYESLENGTFTFFKEGDKKQMNLLEPDAKLVDTIEAPSWGEAIDKKNNFVP